MKAKQETFTGPPPITPEERMHLAHIAQKHREKATEAWHRWDRARAEADERIPDAILPSVTVSFPPVRRP